MLMAYAGDTFENALGIKKVMLTVTSYSLVWCM